MPSGAAPTTTSPAPSRPSARPGYLSHWPSACSTVNRLIRVRRALLPSLCALLLGAAAAIAVGCGGRSHLVPGDAASSMTQQLAAVREDVAAGDCTSAQNALRDARA